MNMKNFFKGALTGVAVGTALGVLFAPKSGKETREDIKKAYDSVSRDIVDKVSKLKDVTEEKYHEIVDKAVAEYRKIEEMTQDQADELTNLLRSRWENTEKK